jgi:Ca-activated chloride channel family protein
MSWGAPHLLWLALLAPAAAALAAWAWRRRLAAATAWAARGLWDRLLAPYRPRRLALSVGTLALAVLGAGLALAQPRWGASTERVERRGVDVVFLLDSSLSMGATDVAPSRLYVAKSLVRRLVERLPGNRVALVQTEGTGVVLAPLTIDAAVIDLLLDTVEPGSLPVPGTELAPGIQSAVRLFPPGERKHRVLVVLSDGEDHGGGLDALLDTLRQEGVVVHALGIGTPEGAPLAVPGGGYKQDEDGRVVISQLHEETLEELARSTGGVYQRVTSAAADPREIVARIQGMEKRTLEGQSLNTLEERFQWPLALACAALLLHLARRPFRPAPQPAAEAAPSAVREERAA